MRHGVKMTIREEYENYESERLSDYAVKSVDSKGRSVYEKPCDIRTIYQQDRDRIIHCKAFRRLKHKTQVFIASDIGDHYRTRLTHTLEVAQISRTIARALRLNEDLTEAIALGHDLGHTPFGHAGERALDEMSEIGFKHNLQSQRVVEKLEGNGSGLNLTLEVRDGIANHTGDRMPFTLEGRIVKLADRIAYINHDIDDAVGSGILKIDEIPQQYLNVLGRSHSDRINTLVLDVIKNSKDKKDIIQNGEIKENMLNLRQFLFENFYFREEIMRKIRKGESIVKILYTYFMDRTAEISDFKYEYTESKERNVLDYVSGMTDKYAIQKFKEIYLP